MSKWFLSFVLILAAFFVLTGVTHLETTKPAVILFWMAVGGLCAYKLFRK
ncbi:MAG: hypothetical protein H0V27_09240 [Pyrinomonadaceae bacterium]|nr:hypothetical protein [Pyrinomonadaceae bacterium]